MEWPEKRYLLRSPSRIPALRSHNPKTYSRIRIFEYINLVLRNESCTTTLSVSVTMENPKDW